MVLVLSVDRQRTAGGSSIGATWPTIVERTVMAARALTAPNQTVKRGWRVDMMAAMKKVLSPNSVPKITPMEAMKASPNPIDEEDATVAPKKNIDEEDATVAAATASSARAIGSSTSATAPSVRLRRVETDCIAFVADAAVTQRNRQLRKYFG